MITADWVTTWPDIIAIKRKNEYGTTEIHSMKLDTLTNKIYGCHSYYYDDSTASSKLLLARIYSVNNVYIEAMNLKARGYHIKIHPQTKILLSRL